MTDKQIMIDGKECRYWFRPNPSDYRICSLRGKNDNCDEINDCFIKELLGKLARKEQECEKLYIQLKADEEYHKEEENTLRKIIKNKEERNIELYKENNKLKQTLVDIKKICNKTVCDYLQCSLNYNHSKDFECEKTSCDRAKRRKFILKILQKISEVENEN